MVSIPYVSGTGWEGILSSQVFPEKRNNKTQQCCMCSATAQDRSVLQGEQAFLLFSLLLFFCWSLLIFCRLILLLVCHCFLASIIIPQALILASAEFSSSAPFLFSFLMIYNLLTRTIPISSLTQFKFPSLLP